MISRNIKFINLIISDKESEWCCMRKNSKLKFTLIEITVAFAVFAILIMVLMQFLGTAQKAWTFSEKRTRAYADVSAFLGFVESVVESGIKHSSAGIDASEKTSLTVKNTCLPGSSEFSDIKIKLEAGKIFAEYDTKDKADEESELISNVTNLIFSQYGKVLMIQVSLFGSEADYKEWCELDKEADKKKRDEYLSNHGFSISRSINL